MNLKALNIFASIMEQGTLIKAADQYCLSVSAASRQLSVLEAELGLQLFTRDKRHLIPTPEGCAFYEEAQRILYGLGELPEIARSIRQEHKVNLRLITIPRLVGPVVSPAIAQMCADHPAISVYSDVQPMRYIKRWVAGFQFHLGLGRLPAEHSDIITRPFCSLPAMVVLSPGHRLAKKSELSLEDLDHEPMVGFFRETLLGKNTDEIFRSLGRVPQPTVEVSSSLHACSIVASGFGYTIGDPLTPHSLGDNKLVLVPLKSAFRFEFAFFEASNARLSETARLFKSYVCEETGRYLQKHGY